MKNYTMDEIELKINQTREEIIKVYEEKPERKELQEIDKHILSTLMYKLESAVIIKFLTINK